MTLDFKNETFFFFLIYYYYYLEPIHDKCNISAGGSNQRSSFQAGPALRDNILGLV